MEDINALSLAALQNGDRREFARLVDETSPPLYRAALRITGDEQDAEDALQETYLKALRSLPNFEGRSSLMTWLYRIAVNEALMLVRRRKPQVELVEESASGDEPDASGIEIVDWGALPEDELLSNEARRFLNQAVQNLSPLLRVVFVLRDLQGLSIAETAETLDVSESLVKTRLLRARLNLRQALSVYFGMKMKEESFDE